MDLKEHLKEMAPFLRSPFSRHLFTSGDLPVELCLLYVRRLTEPGSPNQGHLWLSGKSKGWPSAALVGEVRRRYGGHLRVRHRLLPARVDDQNLSPKWNLVWQHARLW